MPRKAAAKSQEGSLVLPRHMEIADIDEFKKEALKHTRKKYSKFVLDAGEVALIDTAGVQFLVWFLNLMKAKDCEISWTNDSVQIYQMAAELGLAEQIDA